MKIFDGWDEIFVNATSSVSFEDAAGVRHRVNRDVRNGFVEMELAVPERGENWAVMRLTIRNISEEPVFLEKAHVLDVSGENGGMLEIGGLPTSWTVFGRPMWPFPPGGVFDLCNQRWNSAKGNFYFADYALIGNKSAKKWVVLGFLSFLRQHGVIELKAEEDIYNFEYLRATCEFSGFRLDPGEEIAAEPLCVMTTDKPVVAFDRYLGLVLRDKRHNRRPRNISGWGTWDYYHAAITEDEVLANAAWLARHRRDLPVEYIQLDHGYERCEGDWFLTNDKFPHGLKWLADRIKALGFKPGIWLCPFLVARESAVFRKHPDWVIKDRAGKPVVVFGYARPQVHILDCSIPQVQEWIKKLGERVTKEYGYQYVKLDGANVQPMASAGVLADRKMTKAQAMAIGLRKFREGIGEETVLLNGCLFGLSLGVVDAMRIGPDVGARWSSAQLDAHHGERDDYPGSGDLYQPIISTVNSLPLHRKFWINDPDYLIARQKGSHSELNFEEAKTWVSVVGLSNGLVMLSDRMPELKQKRIELLQKVLPQYTVGAQPVGFLKQEVPALLDLKVRNESGSWHVVGVVNADRPERERGYTVRFGDIGLSAGVKYHVFDFWAEKHLGTFRGEVVIARLKPRHSKVLSIVPVGNAPQVISTSAHITQGGVEIVSAEFDRRRAILSVRTADCGKQGKLFVWLPPGYQPGPGAGKLTGSVCSYKVSFDGSLKQFKFTCR